MERRITLLIYTLLVASIILISTVLTFNSFADSKKGEKEEHSNQETYLMYESPVICSACHTEQFKQWSNSMHSKAYDNTFFSSFFKKIAIPDAKGNDSYSKEVKECTKCHAPVAYIAGDYFTEPKGDNPATQGIICDFCHTLQGFNGERPGNANYISINGPDIDPKRGPYKDAVSPFHQTVFSEFHTKADICGTCHNYTNPNGVPISSTYTEYKEGPWSRQGYQCQDCHMLGQGVAHPLPSRAAIMGPEREKVFTHRWPGGRSESQLKGSLDVELWVDKKLAKPGETVTIIARVTNIKAGHKVPTGDPNRQVWLEMRAVDSSKIYPILLKSNSESSDDVYGITNNDLGYRFLERDGLPEGYRIYHIVLAKEGGDITLAPYEAKQVIFDNRIKPKESRVETFKWVVPERIASGEVVIEARLNYRYMPQSLADELGIGKIPIIQIATDEYIINVER